MVDFSGRVSSPSTSPVIVPFAAMDEEELFERNSLAQSISINLDFSDEEADDEHPLLRAYKGLKKLISNLWFKLWMEVDRWNTRCLPFSSQFFVTLKIFSELQNDMSIDACIKKVTYCHIIYGKTVETANEIANLCLAYQDQGHTDFSLDLDRSIHPLSVCLTLL